MSIIATKSVSKTINVPFYGSDLYVVNYNGEPYVPMIGSTVIDIINIALYTCLRGVRTSSKRSKPTPSVLDFLCLIFDGSFTAITPLTQSREGDEYNTRKGNESAALTAVLNLPAPFYGCSLFRKK